MKWIFLLLAITLLVGCVKPPVEPPVSPPVNTTSQYVEITETDIFADIDSLDVTKVTVMGVKLGDTIFRVRAELGLPDNKTEFPDMGVVNLEYGKSIGLDQIGVVYHFEDNVLTKINIQAPFNKLLIGETRLGWTKEKVYRTIGIPERFNDYTKLRVFHYDNKGLEVYLHRNTQIGFALLYPKTVEIVNSEPL